jgi:DNA-binding MarR family transcriptional regulator
MSKANTYAVTTPTTLSASQLAMLSIAAKREDRCLVPPPSLRGAQIAKSGEKLIGTGLVREVKGKASVPVWHRDSATGTAFALKLTSAGMKAAMADETPLKVELASGIDKPVAIEEAAPPLVTAIEQAAAPQPSWDMRSQREPRATSKIAAVIGLLSRAEGATLAELIEATSWLPHTTRAALTGLRKRGYVLTLDRSDGQRGSVYRIDAASGRQVETEVLERATEVA